MTYRSLPLIVVFALVACHGQDQAKRSTPNYQVVAEGSANGVTSTINGPGEKTAPLTDTNVDTTTNFTLPNNPNPLGNATASTSIAGTLPPPSAYPGTSTVPLQHAVQPRTDTRGMASSSAPIVTDTVGSTTPPMPRETRTKPRPDSGNDTTTTSSDTAKTTTTTTSPPETTDTSTQTETTTTTDPKKPAPRNKKQDDQQPSPPPPPPPTDTTSTRG